jgi:hypothetical protein
MQSIGSIAEECHLAWRNEAEGGDWVVPMRKISTILADKFPLGAMKN